MAGTRDGLPEGRRETATRYPVFPQGRGIVRKMDLYTRNNQILVDAIIFAGAFFAAYVIRFEGFFSWVFAKQFLVWLPYLLVARLYVNWKLGIYNFIWRYVTLSDALSIARSLAVVTSLLLIPRLFYPEWAPLANRLRLPLGIIVLEYLLSLTGSLGARALRRILYQRERNRAGQTGQPRRVVLIGAGRAGVMVSKELGASPDTKPVGFLDDDPKKIGSIVNGIRVLGPTSSLPEIVRRYGVEEVVICIPRPPRETLKRLWALCDSLPVQTKIVPTLDEILRGRVSISAFREVQMADLLGRETAEAPTDIEELAPTHAGKRILVTGAGGSIGSELAHQLLQFMPGQLILLDKDENGLHDLYARMGVDSGQVEVHPVVGDLRFPGRVRAVFSRFRPQFVFHAAAHKHVPLMEMNPCEAILNNVVGTRILVDESVASGVEQFVLISTDKAVRPQSIMGASKRVCEMIVQARCRGGATRFSCVRFGNVVGSRGSVVPLFQEQISRGGPITVTHPDMQRFLMTIPEAVRLVIRAGTMGSLGEIFVFDMGDPVPILNLARDLVELSGLRPDRDVRIEITQLRPGEKLVEELYDDSCEELAPTGFEKIRVVKGRPLDVEAFAGRLAALEDSAHRESPEEICRILYELNVGFNPQAGRSSTAKRVLRRESVGET